MSLAYRRYALGGLTAIWTINLLDRGLMAVLLQPIKADLGLSDTELGFLTGIAFALFYAVAGIPLARWSDRGDRITVASISIGLWGVTVMSYMFISSFAQLVVGRIAAAIGEAGCKPPTYSLVGDYFPGPAERTRALAIYLTGSPIAALMSFVLGGWLGAHLGWRMTFFLMGIPGLFLAILVRVTLKDPRHLESPSKMRAHRPLPSVGAILQLIWVQPALRHLSIALILIYGLGGGLASWYGAFLARSHAMGSAEIGLWLGIILSACGLAGVLTGGYISAGLLGGDERRQMRMSAAATLLLFPFLLGFLLIPDRIGAFASLAPAIICIYFSQSPIYTLMQRLVSDDIRATSMALIMLLVSGIGTGLGPQIVGIVSDALRSSLGQDSLRVAMLLVAACAIWAAFHLWKVSTLFAASALDTHDVA